MCNDRCHQVQNCAIGNVDYDDYRMCVTQAKALSANDAATRDTAKASGALTLLSVTAAVLLAENRA